eukprot:1354982-Heterocapsa_arctica.AAC.1
MGVWEKTPRATMEAEGGRAISFRWVDTVKGDHTRPAYRSRVLAREIKKAIRASEVPPSSDLFSGMPPLEAFKAIIT